MNTRERMMAGGILTVFALVAGVFLFHRLYLVPLHERDAAPLKLAGKIDRRLTTKGEHHAARIRSAICRLDFVRVGRLEDKNVGNVEIGRHRLRIVVDDDRRPSSLFQSPSRVNATVVEFNPLADPNRPAAHDDDGLFLRPPHLVEFAA